MGAFYFARLGLNVGTLQRAAVATPAPGTLPPTSH
jgi:hypothetical protein